MVDTKFYRPLDPTDAIELLGKYRDRANILAGGTELMAKLNRRLVCPEVLIYIGECGLNRIREEDGNVLIGAATSFSEILASPLVQEKVPLLAQVVQRIGSPAIRNMGTIGGSLAHASPAADSAVAVLALGAHLRLMSANEERIIHSEDFFTGPGKTRLEPDELLQEIMIPSQGAGAHWASYKMGRRKGQSLPVVSVAVSLQIADGTCSRARIALGAVAPVPLLAAKAGQLLEGNRLARELIDEAARVAAEESDPVDDAKATAWYRRRLCEVQVKRLLSSIFTEKGA